MKDNWIAKLRKSMGVLVVFSILMGILPAYAAWDGYEESEAKSVHLVDMDRRGSVTGTGLAVSGSIRKGHKYSMYWNHGTSKADVYLPKKNTPRDWSQFTTLDFWIYSEKAYGNEFMVVVDCDQKEVEGISYLSYKFNVDWAGWKQFSIPISDMTISRSADLKEVNDVRLVIDGWSMVINPECELYFGEIKLSATDNSMGSIGNLYDMETRNMLFEMLGDGYAIYQGSKNAYSPEDGLVPLDEATGAVAVTTDGVTIVPRAFFETHLGAKIAQEGEVYTLTVGSNVYSGTGKEMNGIIYFPLAETARALGFEAAESDRLTLVGKSDKFSDIMDDALLKEAAMYMAAYQTPDDNELTAADFKQIKDRWRLKLVGDETLDLSDVRIAERVKAIENVGNSAWRTMNKGSDIEELWGKKITASAQMTDEYTKIAAMAKAWATYGSSLYHNKTLRDDILFALQWMYENRYGEAEKTNSGWRSTNLFNWWDWQIGSPTQLIDTLMLMENELDRATITKYLSLFDKLVPRAGDYGANMLDFSGEIIGSGLLQENADRVIVGRDGADPTMVYADGGRNDKQGFYTDGSYIFHTLHPMNGTYGFAQFEKFADLMYLLEGTKFAYCNPLKYNIYEWAINAYEPLIYKGDTFRFVLGRHPSHGAEIASGTVRVYLELLQLDSIPTDVASHLKSTIKYMVEEDTTKSYYQGLSFESIRMLDRIMADDSVEPRENYILNKMYHNMDKMAHQCETWAAGVSMSSSRIYNYESINSENMTGWYLSDGMTYLYSENDLTQYNSAYWAGVDPYRLPGTTVNTGEREVTSVAQRNEYLSSQDFVGGASLGGEYGTAAMYLESYHGDGIGSSADNGYGGSNPPRDCSLEAQKAWFMFDDEVVALGANVHAQDGLPVLTVVENRKSNHTNNLMETSVTPYNVSAVTASDAPEEANTQENTIDGKLETRWAAENEATITWDLGEQKELGYAGLAFWQDGKRQTIFDLEVSADGTNWEQVFSGRSAGKSEALSAYTLGGKTARYIRYCGHGNTATTWNSILEAAFYPPNADGSIALPKTDFVGAEKVTADGKAISLSEEDTALEGTKWIQLEGTGGYYFPEAQNIKARKTNKTPSFFELWLDHGTDPQNATYSYVLLPNKSAEETASYAQNPNIEVLVNTPEIQAVREKQQGVTGYVFWKAGTYDGITVSEPMIVMVKDNGGETEVSVCDPTQKLTSGTVTIDRNLARVSADEGITVANGGKTVITVDFTNAYGKSFETTLSGSGSIDRPADNMGSVFNDLGETAWATEAILQLFERGVVSPAEDGRFRPNDSVTREEFVKLLMEAFGIKAEGAAKPFADETEGAWYTPYLAAARQIGLVNGYDDGRFGVGEQITRQDMAAMAYRAVGLTGKQLSETVEAAVFSDSSEISGYAVEAVTALQQAEVVSGMEDGGFAPRETASRAQAAKIIAGLLEKTA